MVKNERDFNLLPIFKNLSLYHPSWSQIDILVLIGFRLNQAIVYCHQRVIIQLNYRTLLCYLSNSFRPKPRSEFCHIHYKHFIYLPSLDIALTKQLQGCLVKDHCNHSPHKKGGPDIVDLPYLSDQIASASQSYLLKIEPSHTEIQFQRNMSMEDLKIIGFD